MIAGGLTMLSVALLMLTAGPASSEMRRVAQNPDRLPEATLEAAETYKWPLFIQQQAARNGVGDPRLMAVSADSCTIAAQQCASCRRGKNGCRRERRSIQRIARRVARRARVEEAVCGHGTSPCVFQIRMEGR